MFVLDRNHPIKELVVWDGWQPRHHAAEAGIQEQLPYVAVNVSCPRSTKGYFTVDVTVGGQLVEEWLYCRN